VKRWEAPIEAPAALAGALEFACRLAFQVQVITFFIGHTGKHLCGGKGSFPAGVSGAIRTV
jgi:hypothetical protein